MPVDNGPLEMANELRGSTLYYACASCFADVRLVHCRNSVIFDPWSRLNAAGQCVSQTEAERTEVLWWGRLVGWMR